MYASYAREHGIKTTLKPVAKKSCFYCANCEIDRIGQPDEFWVCETIGWGVPCACDPPNYDDAEGCTFYSETEKHDDDMFFRIIDSIQQEMDD